MGLLNKKGGLIMSEKHKLVLVSASIGIIGVLVGVLVDKVQTPWYTIVILIVIIMAYTYVFVLFPKHEQTAASSKPDQITADKDIDGENTESPLTKEDLVRFKKDLYAKLKKDKMQTAYLAVVIMGWSAAVGALIAMPESLISISCKWVIFGLGLLIVFGVYLSKAWM